LIAPKINTEICKIDWNKTVDEVHNLIRGLSPSPGAFTFLNNKMLKIYRSTKEYVKPQQAAGGAVSNNKTFLKFACDNGYIHVMDLQLEGKKRMNIEDFLRGNKIN
jgi:methionyl-tRNA formyltransferase